MIPTTASMYHTVTYVLYIRSLSIADNANIKPIPEFTAETHKIYIICDKQIYPIFHYYNKKSYMVPHTSCDVFCLHPIKIRHSIVLTVDSYSRIYCLLHKSTADNTFICTNLLLCEAEIQVMLDIKQSKHT